MSKKILILTTTFIIALVFSSKVSAQVSEYQIIQSDVIKANPRTPTRTARTTFIENNRKKKRVRKAKVRMLHSIECPSYMAYISKNKKRREKMLRKARG